MTNQQDDIDTEIAHPGDLVLINSHGRTVLAKGLRRLADDLETATNPQLDENTLALLRPLLFL